MAVLALVLFLGGFQRCAVLLQESTGEHMYMELSGKLTSFTAQTAPHYLLTYVVIRV